MAEVEAAVDSAREPFQTKQFAAVIDGHRTEFILSSYSDYLFFVITQLDKLGTLVRPLKHDHV